MSGLKRVFGSAIENERQLMWFVVKVTSVCASLALVIDVSDQLIFFVDWPTALRSWCITAGLALALAIPISRVVGKAQLALFRAKLAAEKLSLTDHLTGLPNRRALLETIPARGEGALALVIADIDRFKRVNDRYGHLAGDVVIKAVGSYMAESLADLGLVVRVGGEEFALLAPDASPAALETRLNDFREKLAITVIEADGQNVRVTISAGVAYSSADESFDRLYSAADRALYAAKASGRNRVVFFDQIRALAAQVEPRARASRPASRALSA